MAMLILGQFSIMVPMSPCLSHSEFASHYGRFWVSQVVTHEQEIRAITEASRCRIPVVLVPNSGAMGFWDFSMPGLNSWCKASRRNIFFVFATVGKTEKLISVSHATSAACAQCVGVSLWLTKQDVAYVQDPTFSIHKFSGIFLACLIIGGSVTCEVWPPCPLATWYVILGDANDVRLLGMRCLRLSSPRNQYPSVWK